MSPKSPTSLSDVRFLLALSPNKCISAFTSAIPKCMWSSGTQKMMWQLQSLPYDQDGTLQYFGKLHAELENKDGQQTEPTPLNISFVSDGRSISQIKIQPTQQGEADGAGAASKVSYRIKSGIYTVN